MARRLRLEKLVEELSDELKPEIAAHLARRDPDAAFPVAALVDDSVARSYLSRARASAPIAQNAQLCPVPVVEDRWLSNEVPLRVYVPVGDAPFPMLVFCHGGGWVLGDIDGSDLMCRLLATQAEAVVVSVGYRRAPEHPHPAAIDDALAAIAWAREHASEFSGDPSRLGVAGSSAGANIMTVAAMTARDSDEPIRMQALFYPVVDYSSEYPSLELFGSGFGLDAEQLEWFWDQYVPEPTERVQPRVAPIRSATVAGMPRTIIITAGCDPLRDEGEAYGARLKSAGVETTVTRYPGQVHGFMNLIGLTEDADRAIAEAAREIKAALASPSRSVERPAAVDG